MDLLQILIIAYLVVINLVAAVMTAVDKYKAVHHHYRISEAALLFVSAIGGSVSMYVMMRIIHHKTRKLKFMLGIPIIFVLQVILVFILMVKIVWKI